MACEPPVKMTTVVFRQCRHEDYAEIIQSTLVKLMETRRVYCARAIAKTLFCIFKELIYESRNRRLIGQSNEFLNLKVYNIISRSVS